MKTGKKENEYIELITGTLFYEDDTGCISKDSSVYFTTKFNYDRTSLDNLNEEYDLKRLELEMKMIYRRNKVLYPLYKNNSIHKKSEGGILKKLQYKHRNKIN